MFIYTMRFQICLEITLLIVEDRLYHCNLHLKRTWREAVWIRACLFRLGLDIPFLWALNLLCVFVNLNRRSILVNSPIFVIFLLVESDHWPCPAVGHCRLVLTLPLRPGPILWAYVWRLNKSQVLPSLVSDTETPCSCEVFRRSPDWYLNSRYVRLRLGELWYIQPPDLPGRWSLCPFCSVSALRPMWHNKGYSITKPATGRFTALTPTIEQQSIY